ncbi:hypothetical protein ACIQU4_28315 [Streptomyces sp. NPDC090741]|uniref:hypothetical protein n=1 Tax=Streptomyces sp. NPDC090741 TaxID=3365967 RepID=UPI0038213D19
MTPQPRTQEAASMTLHHRGCAAAALAAAAAPRARTPAADGAPRRPGPNPTRPAAPYAAPLQERG